LLHPLEQPRVPYLTAQLASRGEGPVIASTDYMKMFAEQIRPFVGRNTYRVLGPKWGTFVMIVDMLKGMAAVKLALLLPQYADSEIQLLNLQIGLGLAAVVGHIFPIWADFRGGKGVATLFGIVVGISPWTALGCSGVFLLVLYLTRFVSLSSILASVAFPVFILVIFNVENDVYRVFAIAVALMVVLTHQKNIGRLLKGAESKVPILKHRDRRRQRRREGR